MWTPPPTRHSLPCSTLIPLFRVGRDLHAANREEWSFLCFHPLLPGPVQSPPTRSQAPALTPQHSILLTAATRGRLSAPASGPALLYPPGLPPPGVREGSPSPPSGVGGGPRPCRTCLQLPPRPPFLLSPSLFSSHMGPLVAPPTLQTQCCPRTFACVVHFAKNTFPPDLHLVHSLTSFLFLLKCHLLSEAYLASVAKIAPPYHLSFSCLRFS